MSFCCGAAALELAATYSDNLAYNITVSAYITSQDQEPIDKTYLKCDCTGKSDTYILHQFGHET